MLGFKLFSAAVKWVMVTVALPTGGNAQGTISVNPYPNQEICQTDLNYSQADATVARVCLASKDYERLVKTGSPIPIFKNQSQVQAEAQAAAQAAAQLNSYRAAQADYAQRKAENDKLYAARQKLYEDQEEQLAKTVKQLQALGAKVEVKNEDGTSTFYAPKKKR